MSAATSWHGRRRRGPHGRSRQTGAVVVDAEQVRETVRALRLLLAELDAGRLSGSAAFRHRIEGAALALDCVAVSDPADVVERLGNDDCL